MSEPKRYDLASIIKAEAELPPLVVITLLDGSEVSVYPPTTWGDDAFTLIEHKSIVRAARAILGEQYDAFIASGGTAKRLLEIIGDVGGVSFPE